eukprot:TRINITY_DN4179_c0_g1_i10.p1 TRINITY_DN4179_c0_g1~~TRINITY_DN4179_c0_g1_i10.p1  ORF type:complete len:500 (+),score=60.25 TRINITY_DN4179_c0_g1_i10:627-2126(+)
MNPGGEHLSIGVYELKVLYILSITAWGFLVGVWMIRWVYNLCTGTKTTILQYIMILSGLLWTGFNITEERFWYNYSHDGYPTEYLGVLSYLILTVSDPIFVGLFMFIGKGFTIIRFRLNPKEKRGIGLAIFFQIIILWLKKFFGDYVLILTGLLFIVIVININTDINRNISNIKAKIGIIAALNIDSNVEKLRSKIKMFQFMRILTLIYFPTICAVYAVSILLLILKPWITTLINQSLILSIYAIYAYIFNIRWKKDSTYHFDIDDHDEEQLEQDLRLNREIKKRLPAINEQDLLKIVTDVVVIKHPDGVYSIGAKYEIPEEPQGPMRKKSKGMDNGKGKKYYTDSFLKSYTSDEEKRKNYKPPPKTNVIVHHGAEDQMIVESAEDQMIVERPEAEQADPIEVRNVLPPTILEQASHELSVTNDDIYDMMRNLYDAGLETLEENAQPLQDSGHPTERFHNFAESSPDPARDREIDVEEEPQTRITRSVPCRHYMQLSSF